MAQMTRLMMTEVANLLPPMAPPVIQTWRQLLQIFHDDHEQPYGDQLTPTQIQIIDIIAKRRFPRTQLILPTQYGKSLAVALGVLLRVSTHKERWAIIAGTEEKARIIMDYIIDHIFDDELFSEQLEYHGTKEKLKQERSKLRITFRDGGEVRVYSGNANNSNQTQKALMGFGAPNVILDESSLIPDDLYSTVKRMVGGAINKETGEQGFILEIGNPFFRNHFYRTWFGERYKKIFVDARQALQEGRYSQDYLDEMAEEAFYDVLYDCLFPDANEVLPGGYRRLVPDSIVDVAMIDQLPPFEYVLDENGERTKNKWGFDIVDDKPVLGVDVSGTGSNKTKLVVRFPRFKVAIVAKTLDTEDLEEVADAVEEVAHRWNIGDYRIVIDAGGVGHGLPAIMHRRGWLTTAVLFGESAPEKTFVNIRAYMYWGLRKWLKAEGGALLRDPGFQEIKLIYFKRNSSDRTLIEPKEEMLKREAKAGHKVESPDTADALVLTFVDTSGIVEEDDIDFD